MVLNFEKKKKYKVGDVKKVNKYLYLPVFWSTSMYWLENVEVTYIKADNYFIKWQILNIKLK